MLDRYRRPYRREDGYIPFRFRYQEDIMRPTRLAAAVAAALSALTFGTVPAVAGQPQQVDPFTPSGGRRRMGNATRRSLVAAAALAASAVVSSPANSAPAETWTTVLHNTTRPVEFFPDDICGPRASYESWVNKVEVNHLTALADGSYHFVDFETGYISVDYVDPAIPDAIVRRTETFNVNLTPGGVYTETLTLRQRDTNDLIIRFSYQLIVVDGVPKVEREAFFLSGCPD